MNLQSAPNTGNTMTIIVRSRDSLLTTSSGYTNYRGILNLVIILLVLSNARAALENVIKYGILVDPISWILFLCEGSKHWPALVIVMGLGVHIVIALLIETVIAADYSASNHQQQHPQQRSKRSPIVLLLANITLVVNLIACISLPPIAIYTFNTHPISTSGSLMIVSIVFLKLVSYHMMNFWCRDLRRPEKLQSKTTRSFLRSYVPPAVEFGAIDLGLEALSPEPPIEATAKGEPKSKPTAGSSVAVKQNGTSILANGSLPKKATTTTTTSLRRRSGDTNNNHNGYGSKGRNGCIAPNGRHLSEANIASKPNGEQANTKPISISSPKLSSKDAKIREVSLAVLAKYPENINLKDMCHYMSYPTLCYELEYAKTERIRKRFLIKRVMELIILSQLDMALVQQWIVPTVNNSILPFRQMQLSHMFERLLKLAIPNHVIWLIWFYMFFHSLLNIIAESTRFADRQFYKDWWNSESVYYFWSNWNIPVHKWCARHLYVPLMSMGFNKCQASTAVFFVSAFFHEYLVSVPLKMFRMWAFTGMLMQLPWARFVSSYCNNYFANVAVWVSLIIGQPLCILMYYHDYYVINNIKALPSR